VDNEDTCNLETFLSTHAMKHARLSPHIIQQLFCRRMTSRCCAAMMLHCDLQDSAAGCIAIAQVPIPSNREMASAEGLSSFNFARLHEMFHRWPTASASTTAQRKAERTFSCSFASGAACEPGARAFGVAGSRPTAHCERDLTVA
jgi:hypothetical protein